MLTSLTIENIATIDKQTIDFAAGLTVITGETGAGKSVLLGALALVLGQRADSTWIRKGQTKASVCAVFDLKQQNTTLAWLNEQGLSDDNHCILRRTLTLETSAKAFINDTPVSLNQLKRLAALLIDVHNQNEHYSLKQTNNQGYLFDDFADTPPLIKSVNDSAEKYQTLSQQIKAISEKQQQNTEQYTLLTHFIDELEAANLDSDELSSIETRYQTLNNAGQLTQTLSTVHQALETENGLNDQLNNLCQTMTNAQAIDEQLSEVQNLLNQAQIQVQEAIYGLTHYLSKLDSDTNTLESLNKRLDLLHSLANKHKTTLTDLLNKQNQLQKQRLHLDQNKENLTVLQKQQQQVSAQYQKKAHLLSEKRHKAAQSFERAINQLLSSLGMKGATLRVLLNSKTAGVHLGGNESISFLVETNPGGGFLPLNKIASGGELSRISLAIAVIASGHALLPTIIFDEVDVGVSGAVAEIVGQKLKLLAKQTQVLCITHLAQVAALGRHHLKVTKQTSGQTVQTQISQLDPQNRVAELARILGGAHISEQSRLLAQEMITRSQSPHYQDK